MTAQFSCASWIQPLTRMELAPGDGATDSAVLTVKGTTDFQEAISDRQILTSGGGAGRSVGTATSSQFVTFATRVL